MTRGLPRTLSRAATRAFGTQTPVAGLRREIIGVPLQGFGLGNFQVALKLTDMLVTVTDALAYASQKLLDFPAGRLYVRGGTASLQFGVTTARASTINDSAAMDWSLGSAAASNVTLATTMVDMIAKQDKTLDGAVAAYTTVSNANFAAAAFFDGTTTPVDAYLNLSFPTATDIDGDGIIKVSGQIVFACEMLGDY